MNGKKLDQFYTKKDIAFECFNTTVSTITQNNIIFDLWLEPSAGTGAFFKLLPNNKIGIDLKPKSENIIQSDFLKFDMLPYILEDKKFVTIGNPPFGKNSSLAIKFFNKCAENSVLIAFILPKTFKKISILNKLNKSFHLIYEIDLPKYSFEFENNEYDVPCVFQIWKKDEAKRKKIIFTTTHDDFSFVKKNEGDFAIQRVGVNAGTVKKSFLNCAIPSHYFIRAEANVMDIFLKINWDSVKYNTAGNPSISKHELIYLYNKEKEKL
jgi:hypothetical protein